MKKCETFEDLQALGTEKIHERTHISRDKVELILTKSYSEIGKVQFMGFISILEREYGLDLGHIRQEYTQYFNEHERTLPPKPSVILQPSSNTRQKWVIAGMAAIGILIGGAYFLQNFISNEPAEEVMKLSTAAIEAVSEPAEQNATAVPESNASVSAADMNESETTAAQSMAVTTDLTIRPIYKVWVGMIDMATGAKVQMITKDPISIDTGKNWLLVLGHGRIEIESSSGKKLLREKDTVYFIYEKGGLKQISKEEFTEYNGGKNW